MAGRAHVPADERRRVSQLHALLNEPGLIHGSLQTSRRRCGRAGCHCAQGEPHESFSLRVVEGGRQLSIHVPSDWLERVRQWLERDREIRGLLQELSTSYVARVRRRDEE